jgi:hypothetical protein
MLVSRRGREVRSGRQGAIRGHSCTRIECGPWRDVICVNAAEVRVAYDNAKAESFMKTSSRKRSTEAAITTCAKPEAPSEPLSKPCTTASDCTRLWLIARLTSTKQH